MRTPMLLAATGLALAGCGSAGGQDQPTTTIRPPAATTTTAPPTTAATPITPRTTGTTRATPGTVRATTTTARATTSTAPALTRAQATARLCAAAASADEAIQRGSFVRGGLLLSSALSTAEKTADPAVATAVRSMLRAGLDGRPESYAIARPAASGACARAGFPIQLSGPVQCITTPCP